MAIKNLYCDSCGKPIKKLFEHYSDTYELCSDCADETLSALSLKYCIKKARINILKEMGMPSEIIKNIEFKRSNRPSINPLKEES